MVRSVIVSNADVGDGVHLVQARRRQSRLAGRQTIQVRRQTRCQMLLPHLPRRGGGCYRHTPALGLALSS
jgi:hypothetical protein